ncbi:MAG: FtsW/RodA/SpoVE family cell cycle protein, partial [Patescibacteria group bacterium]
MFKNLKFDLVLLTAVSFLVVLSLLIIFSFVSSGNQESLGASFFYKQLAAVVIGYGSLFFLAFYDYRVFLKSSTKIYFVAIAILLLVIVLGKNIRGTTGWLSVGLFNFQPVELVKVVMILFLASFLSKKRTELGVRTRIFASLVLTLIPVFLILRQPDLGSSLIIIFIWIGMILASRIGKKNIAILGSVGLLAIFVAFFFLQNYQVERLKNFVDPFSDPKGSGYNVIQSMVAVGSGGFWGKGLGHGSQSQLNFLPEKHTDFI